MWGRARSILAAAIVVMGVVGAATDPASAHTRSTSGPARPPARAGSAPLEAPKTTVVQDGDFLSDVTEADPALSTYEQKWGNVALRALLTDGSAFCAFLHGGGGVDRALVGVAAGARGQEAHTHLPLSVTTFNSVEGVALVTLCPRELNGLPAADRARVRALGRALARRSG